MINRHISFFLFTLSLLSLTDCSSYDIHSRLSAGEWLIKERPDSALTIIECIDTNSIVRTKIKARYSLLHTMAIDRIGKDTTDYSLIKDAVGYYSYHGNSIDKARTSFYAGRIHYNCKDYSSASACFLNALNYSVSIEDEWLKGMICFYLAESYNHNRLKSDELKYSISSYNHFLTYGEQKYIDYAVCRLAAASHNNAQFNKADSLYALISPDSASYSYALLGRAENEISRASPDSKAAVSYFEEAYKEGAPFALCNLYQYAYALLLDGQTEAADRMIARMEDRTPDVKSVWWKYAIARKKGDDKNALLYYEDYARQQSSYISSLLSQSLYKAESSFYSAQKEQAESRTKIILLTMIAVALALSLIIFLILGITANRRRKIESERNTLAQRVNDIQGLLDTLKAEDAAEKEHNLKLSGLQASYVSMYREQFSEIGKLIGTNLDISPRADIIQRKHLSFINEILAEISSDDGKNKKFEERVNRSLDNVVLKIRTDFPDLTEESIRLLCLVIVGFKDPSIATIMNKSTSAISTRKSRLKKQILEADSPNHELYDTLLK